jgi:hypothetical protein
VAIRSRIDDGGPTLNAGPPGRAVVSQPCAILRGCHVHTRGFGAPPSGTAIAAGGMRFAAPLLVALALGAVPAVADTTTTTTSSTTTTTTTSTTSSTTTTTLPPTPISALCSVNNPAHQPCDCETSTHQCTVTGLANVNAGSTLDFTAFQGKSWDLVVAAGGDIEEVAGDLVITISANTIWVKAGGKLHGPSGWFTLMANGAITIAGTIDVSGTTAQGGGGDICLMNDLGPITISGTLNADGTDPNADGGCITVTANEGAIQITSSTDAVSARGGSMGSGGAICLTSTDAPITVVNELTTTSGMGSGCINLDAINASITVGPLDVSGTSKQGGCGGMVMLTADVDIEMTGAVNANGSGTNGNGGDGGDICVAATNNLDVKASPKGLQARGGDGGFGGCIDLMASEGALTVDASLDASSNGGGGQVCLTGGTSADVRGAVNVSDSPIDAFAGSFDGSATGAFIVESEINADGGTGFIQIGGNTVTVTGAAYLHADNGQGLLRLTAGCDLEIAGPLPGAKSGALLSAQGQGGTNAAPGGQILLQSGGKMNVAAGSVFNVNAPSGQSDGTVELDYADPHSPPSFSGTIKPSTVNATTKLVAPQLLVCAPPTTTTTTTTTTLPHVTTTTTTTTLPHVTSTTTLPHATTTTTLPPVQTPCATDADCPADACMVAHCTAGVCGTPAVEPGVPGVMCLLGRMGTLLATPGAVRSATLARTLKGQLGKVAHLVETASGKHKATKLRKARATLQAFMNKVGKAQGRKIDPTVGTAVRGAAGLVLTELGTL